MTSDQKPKIMSTESPLSKRIKRHVIGRRRTYFVATSLGFEDLCYKELSNLNLSIENASVVEGGVEFKGQLQDCYQANLHLRTANRILLRIDRFKASGFRQLEKKVAEIPWELYLPPDMMPDIHVTTRHCRLYHTEAIGRRFLEGIPTYSLNKDFRGEEKKETLSDLTIFVRGVDDRFTVSIDSSGNHLHKRGLKRHHGKAPIRETLAAAALLLVGYNGKEPLIDPMCGSGTFSLEAALLAKNIPPGWFREFAFMRWPSFRQKRWEYLKQQCKPLFKHPRKPMIFASDEDLSACNRLEKCIQQNHLSEVITVSRNNFFDFLPGELTDQTGVVVLNPPYGRRLGSLEKSRQLFGAICDKLNQAYKGWKVVLVAPDRKLIKKMPFKLNVLPIFHGGLKPAMMFGKIP
jgi:putative N6-adenine-specific DNA methylase